MKTRSGFVSNSSSSSFLVGFVKKPTTVEEMKQVVFGDAEFHGEWGELCPTMGLAAIILEDIKDQVPMTKDLILEFLIPGSFPGEPSTEDFHLPGGDRWTIDWDKYEAAKWTFVQAYYDKEVAQYDGKLEFYSFEYEDHTSVGSCLEHGGTFERMPYHLRVSNH
jgi:hypothetical protein